MFRFNVKSSDSGHEAQTSTESLSMTDVLQAQEELLASKAELLAADQSLEELDLIYSNVESAIKALKQHGCTVENMSVLNADGALDDLIGLSNKLESLESMSDKALEALQNKYLIALEEQQESLWKKFIAMLRRMWDAIKTFFRNLWLKLKSFFKKDKEWYAKAKAANDRLEKEPELKKTVDDLIATAEIKDGQVVWNEGLWAKFKSMFKKDKATEALDVLGLEDYVLSMNASTDNGGEMSAKGSGFIRYDQVAPLVDFLSKRMTELGNDPKAPEVAAAGGPVAYFIAKARSELDKFVPSKEITHEDIQRLKYKLIGKVYEGIGEVICHMPDIKNNLKTATKGILDLTKCEFYFTGTVFKLEVEMKVKTSEGKLGELGWTRKNILEAYDKISKIYDFIDGQNYGEGAKLAIDAFEKLKFADDVRQEDIQLIRSVLAIETRGMRFIGQQYSMLLKQLAKTRRFLQLVPERLWVNREFKLDETKKLDKIR